MILANLFYTLIWKKPYPILGKMGRAWYDSHKRIIIDKFTVQDAGKIL
jgi:hypothetical protein